MIYVFYNNDPLAQDQGGGAEHFRGLHRALMCSGLEFELVAARLQHERGAPNVTYVSEGSHFGRYFVGVWKWFWRNRHRFNDNDVFHFHRNYAAWPKLALAPEPGRLMLSYHNVTGKVIEGKLGALAAPIRAAMVRMERRVVELADAIVCVSGRDRQDLGRLVARGPFAAAKVIPAAFDGKLFDSDKAANGVAPPAPHLANKLLTVGRISHQKNIPLAIATLETLTALGHDYTLTIAGEGEDSRMLMKRIADSPAASKISWIGRVPHDQVPKLLREHGTLLLTSRYEASPTVVKEALKAMRPVVSTDVGDVPDWLDEEQTGFVRSSNPQALAQGVLAASELIEDGRYSATSTMDRLSEEAIMGEVVQIYRQLQAAV